MTHKRNDSTRRRSTPIFGIVPLGPPPTYPLWSTDDLQQETKEATFSTGRGLAGRIDKWFRKPEKRLVKKKSSCFAGGGGGGGERRDEQQAHLEPLEILTKFAKIMPDWTKMLVDEDTPRHSKLTLTKNWREEAEFGKSEKFYLEMEEQLDAVYDEWNNEETTNENSDHAEATPPAEQAMKRPAYAKGVLPSDRYNKVQRKRDLGLKATDLPYTDDLRRRLRLEREGRQDDEEITMGGWKSNVADVTRRNGRMKVRRRPQRPQSTGW